MRGPIVFFLLMLASGCASLDAPTSVHFSSIRGEMLSTESGVGAALSESAASAEAGLKALREGRYKAASAHLNQALKLNARSSRLHFLNALVYHLRGDLGNEAMYPLAASGYEVALRFEPDNWQASHLYGRMLLSMREFRAAQSYLADAALYQPRNEQIARDLAVASYYAGDLPLSYALFQRLTDAHETDHLDLMAAALLAASMNDDSTARRLEDRIIELDSEAIGKDMPGLTVRSKQDLSNRINDWADFYRYVKDNSTEESPSRLESDLTEDTTEDNEKMLAVDVVIIRTQDDLSGSKGVNLLDGLQLQFGQDSIVTSGMSWKSVNSKTSGGTTQTITRAINIPSINYSLNIVNSSAERTRVLATPTLVATFDEESSFFSGVEVDVSLVGGSNADGDVYNKTKEIGVSLTITPEKTDEGLLKLEVEAERTFLTTPNTTSITYTYRIDTSKTSLDANVVMDYGQTLILGGLDDKEGVYTDNKTPGLGDIPVLGNLFSREVKSGYQKSVLILLTPKRPVYENDDSEARAFAAETLELYKSRNADLLMLGDGSSPIDGLSREWVMREIRRGDIVLKPLNLDEILL